MPGKRLEVDQQERLPKFAIVGIYSSPQTGNFVNHVGLLREETLVSFGTSVPVWHTVPLVVAGDRISRMVISDLERIEVCAAAFLDGLSISETRAIETALHRIDGLVRRLSPRCKGGSKRAQAAGFSEHYTACPAVELGRDKTTADDETLDSVARASSRNAIGEQEYTSSIKRR